MELNNRSYISYKKQIKILKKALFLFRLKFYFGNCTGLCNYLYKYCHICSARNLTLFNFNNARDYMRAKSCHRLFWWKVGKIKPRKQFLKWMLKETKKLYEKE